MGFYHNTSSCRTEELRLGPFSIRLFSSFKNKKLCHCKHLLHQSFIKSLNNWHGMLLKRKSGVKDVWQLQAWLLFKRWKIKSWKMGEIIYQKYLPLNYFQFDTQWMYNTFKAYRLEFLECSQCTTIFYIYRQSPTFSSITKTSF